MFTKTKLSAYAELVRLNRPIGIYLLLWPTLWALLIAGEGKPSLTVTIVFILGVILMRSAGCAINDYADRNIDGYVERTKNRPIITGSVTKYEALAIFITLCSIAFLFTLFFLNQLTLLFSFIAVLLAASYPFTKRLHYLPQVHLGLAFAWAVPMAFTAETNAFPSTTAWLLLVATILWTTAYDTIYGMIDRDDDINLGIKSTAILFGDADRIIIGALQSLTILSLMAVGTQVELRYWFYISLFLASSLFVYQQIVIYRQEPKMCLIAFLNNNYVGMIIFIGILLSYWLPF
ncbi:MAG: 4-hydroxybenzoate octaprenyltransferase [Pseudomonadota bacterium]